LIKKALRMRPILSTCLAEQKRSPTEAVINTMKLAPKMVRITPTLSFNGKAQNSGCSFGAR
jgi:hypothetical protein